MRWSGGVWSGKITRPSSWMLRQTDLSNFRWTAHCYRCSEGPCSGRSAVPGVWARRRRTESPRCSPTSPRCRCTPPADPCSCRSRRVHWPTRRTAPADWAWRSDTHPSRTEPDGPYTNCEPTIRIIVKRSVRE